MNRRRRSLAGAVLAVVALLGMSACAGGKSADADTLVVGASPVPHAEILAYVRDNLAAQNGLKLKLKELTDYVQPNLAVDSGELDANFFQHKPYLDDFASKRGIKLTSVVAVHVEPLGVYSKKTKSLADLPSGATVVIPNDATNGGRALKLLADNGVIALKEGAGVLATERDVVNNPKNLKFKPLEAAQLPRSLDDVQAAVLNGNYALEAGLKPATDALALEKAEGNPYANLLVVKTGKESDPRVKKLAELLTSPEVKKFITDKYSGALVAAF